ncbi:hypothetical protein B0A69_09680 [Chryseobacterium shigense]|uniref:Uncharacterized protein n=1 Tax=Chryseobacterium shigense TaxID=297244 RepID=A0A1N7IGI8_9FLAO|nr:hypothetical protein [Chryseobacterium shigense]PQA94710.1 hypothetical protein B0A69_09680 [Chryseobacterium shigense]SIS36209.1 hypothetical protein SAMN05421639_103726 [Chryseobacterium shigense]
MATTTIDYKAINTQIASVRTYSKKCTFSVGSVILNSNIQESTMFISNQRFMDLSMKLKTSLVSSISLIDGGIIGFSKLKYTALFDKTISGILKIQADKYSVECTDEGILFSLKRGIKAVYIDLSFDDNNVLYSLFIKSASEINNFTDTMDNAIISINNYLGTNNELS